MSSKYQDITAILNVIGNVYNHPYLLEYTDKYTITENDFSDKLHQVVFGTIYNLFLQGVQKMTLQAINDYLSTRPKSKAIYEMENGEQYVLNASQECQNIQSFDYYYNRLKKFSLLRAYDNCGIDITDIYDMDNLFDAKSKQAQEDYLDSTTLEDIADRVDAKISNIRMSYVDATDSEAVQASYGLEALIDKFKETPEIGVPLYGSMVNTVTRGARLKKFYLRSAPTGMGKSRSMIADACTIACNQIYDDEFGWHTTGEGQPTLYITTEQELEEIQTMMLAFLSNVNEEHIINGKYMDGEEERVRKAIEILKESPLYVEELPDFSLQDVENVIKKNIRDHKVLYVFNP